MLTWTVPSERPEVGWSASAHANMITGNAFPAKLTRHCEVFFIFFLDKLFLVGAPYIQYVFRVRDRDMYIGERERERWSWSNLKNESIPTERMRRGLLSTAQVSVHLASQFLSCTTTWTQCMISKRKMCEDVMISDESIPRKMISFHTSCCFLFRSASADLWGLSINSQNESYEGNFQPRS